MREWRGLDEALLPERYGRIVRDFRGSLTTDIKKGVFITTGSFTKAAREEASNAGKQQIDLIDGEEFINKLIEYSLGVKERTVYEVDKAFFEKV